MTLINCPECNHEVSTKALACPNCGSPPPDDVPSKDISPDVEQTPQTQNKHSYLEIKVTLIVVFLLFGGVILLVWMAEQAEIERITPTFNTHRESILQKVRASIDVGAYDMALIYGERYEAIGDEELNSLLTAARDGIHYGSVPKGGNVNPDLAWHAQNTYGWDCSEVTSQSALTSDGYFFIHCKNGTKLRVYPRSGTHPKITNATGGWN